MKEERYEAKTPKHLVIGDPWYFERKSGKDLQRLIVDYRPPEDVQTAIILSENEAYGITQTNMTMYFAPKEHIKVYMDDMIYEGQETKRREIPVDTAKYYMDVDGRKENIYTSGDGYWGQMVEYYHEEKNRMVTDAVIVSMAMPDSIDFVQLRSFMNHLFEEIHPIRENQITESKREPDRKR